MAKTPLKHMTTGRHYISDDDDDDINNNNT